MSDNKNSSGELTEDQFDYKMAQQYLELLSSRMLSDKGYSMYRRMCKGIDSMPDCPAKSYLQIVRKRYSTGAGDHNGQKKFIKAVFKIAVGGEGEEFGNIDLADDDMIKNRLKQLSIEFLPEKDGPDSEERNLQAKQRVEDKRSKSFRGRLGKTMIAMGLSGIGYQGYTAIDSNEPPNPIVLIACGAAAAVGNQLRYNGRNSPAVLGAKAVAKLNPILEEKLNLKPTDLVIPDEVLRDEDMRAQR